ncbi:MAG: extensin family protein [Yoonia sp.]|uniref:extensin-like domain-containing protein n=1 Tax=Yoonia sp. TaxID=2212373 RepID=UPI003299A75A
MILRTALLLCTLGCSVAFAQEATQRPNARPTAQTIAPVAPVQPDLSAIRPLSRTPGVVAMAPRLTVPSAELRPTARPYERPELAHGAATDPQLRAEQDLFAFSPTAPALSERPTQRPAAIERAAQQRAAAVRRGQVCGDPAIQGEAIGRVNGRGRCGIDNAVRVRSVAGVTLQPAATIDCRTASALKRWVTTGAQPATGGQAASLRVVSHYACRNRNAASTGRLSEHAFGKAIDIAGIGLKSGREITVLSGWNSSRDSNALRRMWQAACGPFGTVLGPNANRFHRDHFHFDTASYRSGSYCR